MPATSKYFGLCETCDHDATCTMRRSPQLEIIHCEQFTTQPVMARRTAFQGKASSPSAPESRGIVTGSARRITFRDRI